MGATKLVLLLLGLVSVALGFLPHPIPAAYEQFEPAISLRHHIHPTTRDYAFVQSKDSPSKEEKAVNGLRGLCGNHTQWIVKDSYSTAHNGIYHVYLRQTYQDLEIANSPANVNFDRKGGIINIGEACYVGGDKPKTMDSTPKLNPVDVVYAFASRLGLASMINRNTMVARSADQEKGRAFIVTGHGFAENAEIPVELNYLQTEAQELNLTWHLIVQLPENWFDVHVAAHSGEVLSLIDWVKWDSYEVYGIPNLTPLLGGRVIKNNPADLATSPRGWLDQGLGAGVFTTTAGNNVIAQINPLGGPGWQYNYRPDAGLNRTFHFPIDFFSDPYDYRDAAITNLFYWNNIIHDMFYLYGFTEAAGNFQENNFGKGGVGNDAVQANAQDGSGYNGANFATPPDGARPRMRMYLWDRVIPMLDGDLASTMIIHEYGHGISNRLTGGPSNSNCLGTGQPGGMGEGWSDWWAILLLQTPQTKPSDEFAMGEYVAGRGIRPFPYTTDFSKNPQTFAYINREGYNQDFNVHAKGSVWCTILFEAYWEIVTKHGFDPDWYRGKGGNNALLRNVVDGLKLQPCRPNFVDARNAIILADKQNFNSLYTCDMWRAFARRGLGFSAVGFVEPVVEAFDLPDNCRT